MVCGCTAWSARSPSKREIKRPAIHAGQLPPETHFCWRSLGYCACRFKTQIVTTCALFMPDAA
ncbi:hypothetical protein AWP75_07595 [Escherichia coli]|uniref:Uncharacterized protein n=1 Tax=Escherichia coli TaxID=562 RepID=A0A1Q9L7L1_ECOLX|nr:hypothetical protein AWP53_26880 [Escherichia coli]OKV05171.1 hypothetical protein AWP47_26580 [Escherichia coli]OKV19079.1 hypothetical protein AWP54_27510 [Escherichia coli]OKV54211.1 hypothetical protein AWP62_08675 [Escherichia coli]OKW02806.1 hypothetical protein AWP69_13220 [Escherichia coli]